MTDPGHSIQEGRLKNILNITSGDSSGGLIEKCGVPGEVFVWHDIMYDGPRKSGWPDAEALLARAKFIEVETGGGLKADYVLKTFKEQYRKLEMAIGRSDIVLWFDACLFDQSMLAHILTCLSLLDISEVELICVDKCPGIEPFNGLGEMTPEQLASTYGSKVPVTETMFRFATVVDAAFAEQDIAALNKLAGMENAPLAHVPAAARRWLKEQPSPESGLGKLEHLIIDALNKDCTTPWEIFKYAARNDDPPQYWGDTTLWAKINSLAERLPPRVKIIGPSGKLPQWGNPDGLHGYKVTLV